MPPINLIVKEDIQALLALGELNTYQAIALKSAIYPGQGTPLGLVYVALKLNGEAGEFAEHVGKAIRDDGLMREIFFDTGIGPMSEDAPLLPNRRESLIKEAGDVLWYLAAVCRELDMTLLDVAIVNLEKLQSRGERNKLQGSGDDR